MGHRDFNREYQDHAERAYAYDFDYRLRGFILRALAPYYTRRDKALELGCFEGVMTRMLAERFDDLTVFEAADKLIAVAKRNVPEHVRFVHTRIEDAAPDERFDSIFLIHTLEHLDQPVDALRRMGAWLKPDGKLFVVVPNAHAASRQIAVGMGLISHNAAITPGEAAHGHRITYSLDTLANHIREAGLRASATGGIFFKPLANFQLDRSLSLGIIDEPFLEGCYQMGMRYPDLAASVFAVCQRPATG